MKLLFSLFEYIAYILGCTCSVMVDDVRIKYSKAAVSCHETCFTMLFVQWMRAELEYFCLAAYKGSQMVIYIKMCIAHAEIFFYFTPGSIFRAAEN